MQLSVVHRTVLSYDQEIVDTAMEMRLRPRDEAGQRCLSYQLHVDPRGPIRNYRDPFGNLVELYNFRAPHRRVVVEAQSVVETAASVEALLSSLEQLPEGERHRLLRFDGPVVRAPGLNELVQEIGRGVPGEVPAALAGLIHRRFVYEPNVTNVTSTVEDLLRLGRGVCQDFAHLWVGLCRAVGMPARYVSGYLWSGNDRQEGASHAWGEVWLDGVGWLGYDPTNWSATSGGRVGEQHVRVAVGRDYRDVPPTRGVYRGAAQESLTVGVRVTRAGGTVSVPSPSGRRSG